MKKNCLGLAHEFSFLHLSQIGNLTRQYSLTTKDTKGSEIYTLKLRELRAFVVGPSFLRPLRSLRLNVFFGCGYAALRLCGEYSVTTKVFKEH